MSLSFLKDKSLCPHKGQFYFWLLDVMLNFLGIKRMFNYLRLNLDQTLSGVQEIHNVINIYY